MLKAEAEVNLILDALKASGDSEKKIRETIRLSQSRRRKFKNKPVQNLALSLEMKTLMF